MRVALLADVHANLAALDAVIAACQEQSVDRYIAVGDMVGYGPQPRECIARLRDLDASALAGNHELYLLERAPTQAFSARARKSLEWTRTVLDEAHIAWLATLPDRVSVGPVVATHAALDSRHDYIVRPRQAARQLRLLAEAHGDARVLVLGHTHQPLVRPETGRSRSMASGGSATLHARRTLINPGSVGQSRQWERTPRARFAILDLNHSTVRWFAIHYDRASALVALARVGLPPESIHVRPSPWRALARAVRTHTDLSVPGRLRDPRPRHD